MNYCATHNQFYQTHCVYCGPPKVTAPDPIEIKWNGFQCADCSYWVPSGAVHYCTAKASGTSVGVRTDISV